jgi:peptidyl-prolyl cis-trans isomerase D
MPPIETRKKSAAGSPLSLILFGRQERHMLQFMRKHAKNWLMKILLLVIIIVFIFYFGSLGGKEKAGDVAKVGGKAISYVEFRKEYENLIDLYRRQYGENVSEETLKKLNLKQKALDNLIHQAIVYQKARDLKIEVSPEEVQASIASYPAFQRNGAFDKRLYQHALRSIKMTAEDFEEAQRNGILTLKLEGLIRESAKVSEREVREFYRVQNEKTNLAFIKMTCQNFRSMVKASETDLEKFLTEQGEAFRIPERMQVKYIVFRGDDFARSARISDGDVRNYYDLYMDSFKRKDGKIPPLADVKDKITAAIRQGKGMDEAQAQARRARNTIYQDEKFDEYARKNQLNVHTSDLFVRNHPPKDLAVIKDLDDQLGTLKAGQMSPVLPAPKGFFLIQLISRKTSHVPRLAEVKSEVEKRYAEVEARRLCRKEAEDILSRLKKGEDPVQVAREKGLRPDETGFFGQGTKIPKIGESRDLAQAVFQLSERKPYPDQVFSVDGNDVIIRFKGRKLEGGDYESQKRGIAQFLLRFKERLYFQSWIAETKEALLKEGKIKISEEFEKM